jgi:hypothetical protein
MIAMAMTTTDENNKTMVLTTTEENNVNDNRQKQ